jgi:hypothetical protein
MASLMPAQAPASKAALYVLFPIEPQTPTLAARGTCSGSLTSVSIHPATGAGARRHLLSRPPLRFPSRRLQARLQLRHASARRGVIDLAIVGIWLRLAGFPARRAISDKLRSSISFYFWHSFVDFLIQWRHRSPRLGPRPNRSFRSTEGSVRSFPKDRSVNSSRKPNF